MIRWALYVFPLALIASCTGCSHPAPRNNLPERPSWRPFIHQISLRDTLPERAYSKINPSEKRGIMLSLAPGEYTAYFEYSAPPQTLLEEIGSLPFSLYGNIADTLVYPISAGEVLNDDGRLARMARGSAAFFYENDPSDFDAFECRKPPFRHLILIQRGTNRILHRVERTL